jgi:hypothetical protein
MAERLRRVSPATYLFAAAAAVSGGLLLHWIGRLTFWRDEWGFLLDRRGSGIGVFLDPFVEQLLAVPILIYKVLVAVFGMDSIVPFALVSIGLFLLSVVLLYVYVARRVGPWLALAAALPFLFLGQAWDDLLFPFQMSFFGSMSCGLGALLALDRDDRRGDLLACVLLTAGLLFSHVGIPFVAAVALEIALRDDRFRRVWIVAIPTAIWGVWYLGWGHTAQNFVSFHNFATLPGYVPDGWASSLSSILGLGAPRDETAITPLDWGRPLLVAAVAIAIWRLAAIWPVPRRFWSALALLTVFFCLTGLNASFFGQADSGRYQYIGGIFLILVAAELARGLRPGRWVIAGALAVACAAALANVSTLRDAANGLAGIARQEKGGLAALQLTRGVVDPHFHLTQENSDVDYLLLLRADRYFSAVDDWGSPAYTPAELASSSEESRVAADKVFAAALNVKPAPAPPGLRPRGCRALAQGSPVQLPVGGAVVRATSGRPKLALRRYSLTDWPVSLGSLSAGETATLAIPRDRSQVPWSLALTGAGGADVCAPRG